MRYCTNCGNELPDNARFCSKCGQPVVPDRNFNSFPDSSFQETEVFTSGIEGRSLVKCIVLSLVTCGIYEFFWMAKLNDDVNFLIGDDNATSGGMVVFLTLITCGIYGLYWLYQMGLKCNRFTTDYENRSLIYLVLGIVGLSIVSCALMQDVVNRTVGYSE